MEGPRLQPVLRYLMLEALGILVPCDGLISWGPPAATLVMLDPLDFIRVLLDLLGMNLVIPKCMYMVEKLTGEIQRPWKRWCRRTCSSAGA